MTVEVKKAQCSFSHAKCGVLVGVEKETGEIVSIEGNPEHPVNAGRLCERCTLETVLDFHHHPDRINYPLKRVGKRGEGKWERISWDQALDEIAAKLKELAKKYGTESMAAIPMGTYRLDFGQLTSVLRFMIKYPSLNWMADGERP